MAALNLRTRVADLKHARAEIAKKIRAERAEYVEIVKRAEDLPDGEKTEEADRTRLDELDDAIDGHERQLQDHEDRIQRAEKALEADAKDAKEIKPGEGDERGYLTASARDAAYEKDKSLVIGGLVRMLAGAGGNPYVAREVAASTLGDRHPVTEILRGERGFSSAHYQRELMAGVGPSGGFLVPPDYVAELIELLRPMTVVRASNPRMIEMPRGTMQMPRQTEKAVAAYSGETTAIPVSQQAVGQIVATYKKLTALTPITNDLIRYSNPGLDALVRDDLAQVIARREDLAFIRGDGTQESPRGFASYALPAQQIASNPAYTLSTAAQEIMGILNNLETANVPMANLVWIMHPRCKNYLFGVQNSNGFYVYREEMETGKLFGWPFKTTTQIPTNITVGSNSDCSEVYLVAMDQAMLFDSMRLEIAVSREGTYTDASNNIVSVFQQDQMLIRAIAEHDFHMRHDEAIAMLTGVRWAPSIS